MKKIIFILGLVAIVAAIVVSQLLGLSTNEQVIQFFEKTIAPDGVITCRLCLSHKMTSFLVVFGLNWVILFLDKQGLDRFRIGPLKKYMKLAYLITAFLIIAWFVIKDRDWYVEDHFFEQLTLTLLLCASIFLGFKSVRPGILKRPYLLMGCIVFFILAMEEISWGQRIFHVETPAILTQVNYQDELNLHNIFNPIIHNVYSAVSLLLGLAFISLKPLKAYLTRFSWWNEIAPFFPSDDFALFGLVFLFLSCEVAVYGGELTEEIFSVLAAAYAADLFFKSQKQFAT
jgi:hypothetical protein